MCAEVITLALVFAAAILVVWVFVHAASRRRPENPRGAAGDEYESEGDE